MVTSVYSSISAAKLSLKILQYSCNHLVISTDISSMWHFTVLLILERKTLSNLATAYSPITCLIKFFAALQETLAILCVFMYLATRKATSQDVLRISRGILLLNLASFVHALLPHILA